MGALGSKESTPKRKAPPPISAADRATLDLKNARDRLQKYKTKLEQDDAKIVAKARAAKAEGKTKAALNLLRIRKLKTKEVEAVEAQLLNVLQMVQTIDSKQNEVQVLEAMKKGKDTLQKLHEETTLEDVLTLMDEIQEQDELEQEMNQVFSNTNIVSSLSVEDDAQILAELEAMMAQEQSATETEKLPVAPSTKPLPEAPSTKLPESRIVASPSTSEERVAVPAS